jgi:hypothetical protein
VNGVVGFLLASTRRPISADLDPTPDEIADPIPGGSLTCRSGRPKMPLQIGAAFCDHPRIG